MHSGFQKLHICYAKSRRRIDAPELGRVRQPQILQIVRYFSPTRSNRFLETRTWPKWPKGPAQMAGNPPEMTPK